MENILITKTLDEDILFEQFKCLLDDINNGKITLENALNKLQC